MTPMILLFAIGILFVLVEVIIPGGILGMIGGLLMFGGCILAFIDFGTWGGLGAILAAFGVTGILLYFEFKVLPRTTVGKRAFLTSEITGVAAAFGAEAQEMIGKSAAAMTMLSPSGYVLVEGHRYEAFCQSGQVPVGTALRIVGADNFRLIVSTNLIAS
jgi:membrane-bound ClpP family serine protease